MPLSTNDFSPIMQRVKDSGAQGVFAFLPSGPTTLGFVKAFNDNGLKSSGIKLFAPGDLTQESDLPALGEAALGMQTTFHYAVSHDSPENKTFVEAATKAIGNPKELSFPAVGAFDGMYVISKMIEATGGKQDAEKAVAAVKGLSGQARAALSASIRKADTSRRTSICAKWPRQMTAATTTRKSRRSKNRAIRASPQQNNSGHSKRVEPSLRRFGSGPVRALQHREELFQHADGL